MTGINISSLHLIFGQTKSIPPIVFASEWISYPTVIFNFDERSILCSNFTTDLKSINLAAQ